MTQQLNRLNVNPETILGASAPERTGIIHFGLGNFHRAHAAVNTALAMAAEPGDWGIVGIANRSRKVTSALEAQDGLYSVVTLDPEAERVDVVDVHRRFLVAAEDGPAIIEAIVDPAHKIITLTISENGYHLDGRTGTLDVSSPDIAADLVPGAAPTTPLGQIVAGLTARFTANAAPITVLSCDNLLSAGNTTRAAVVQFAQAAGSSPEFLAWLEGSVTFPNAMVDRIVPAPTDGTTGEVEEALGLHDEAPVPAELFTMWVIEDKFAAGRPKWEAAGAIFSDEVEKYELVKLRLLNGGHSLIAYLGGLDRQPTIPDSRAQQFIADATRQALEVDYLPSIDLPADFDPQEYIDSLFRRWSNTVLGDKTSRVGSDGSTKLLQRVPIPALTALAHDRMPEQLALTVSAWICCCVPPRGFEPGAIADAMIEPKAAQLKAATQDATTVREHVEAILDAGVFPDDLVAQQPFRDRVVEYAERIVEDGVRAAAALALQRGSAN
jgi:fructuronate reductase